MGRAEERRARQRGARRAETPGGMGRSESPGGMGRSESPGGRRRSESPGGRRRAEAPGGGRRRFPWKKLMGAFLAVCALGMAAFIGLYIYIDVPTTANADAGKQSNIYRYSNGKVFARDGEVNRELVPISKVPKGVQHAFVAAENKTFYTDAGVDLKGTLRGLISTAMGRKQGGSTITQQYVKNFYLTQDQTLTRKAKEMIIALKVDQQRSKDYILSGYMNTSYYGRGAHGVQAAARAYYDVDSKDLTTEQGAYLAALLQAPSQYDWSSATDTSKRLVKQRWNYVLDNMVEMKWLGPAERRDMKFPEPEDPKPTPGLSGQAGYLVKAANDELIASGVDEAELGARGWDITLAISESKQKRLERAVKETLNAKLDPDKRKVDGHVQAGAVSVDPKTGDVVALYGGRDATRHYLSNATRRDYQPASTFKPIVFASALQNGSKTQDGVPITASTVYDGTSERPVRGSVTPFAPPNEDDKDYGQITVQKAMNASVNSVFAQMVVDVGLDRTKQTALNLGMSKKAGGFEERPAMSLGVMGASPLDMASVYATFDNHGKKVTPRLVKSAERGDQKVKPRDAIGDAVITRQSADAVTSVLTGVVDEGTGAIVQSTGRRVAGKTGTSDDNKSAWFAGYTPELVTTVGLFGEGEGGRQVSLSGAAGGGRVNGGGFPAQIWAAYTKAALQGQRVTDFELDTEQGAAVAPTPSPSPSDSGASTGPSAPGSGQPTAPSGSGLPPSPSGSEQLPTQPPMPPDGTGPTVEPGPRTSRGTDGGAGSDAGTAG
ncbi:transglycosylase domain-containing protein [Streptomyces meridianus]|uniref:Penicillin-binding protein n=1 Tax=Streptomyces meridianus TaxID=2938945 RepID=A0ABT0X3N2_9ACTN|nr:transglycosylase domain-containing protein [Streptomyces meridianus]MCM2576272.1 penicillin-binding protein [Streptomyces meridianus]